MPTLAVRPLAPKDIRALRHVHQRTERLGLPVERESLFGNFGQTVAAMLPARRERSFVALVDGELCALATMRPVPQQFRWNVLGMAAGSPRLETSDDNCAELWAALLEYAIRCAGEAGAKRLFAVTDPDGPGHDSLRATGFEPYSRLTMLEGRLAGLPLELPAGMREQEPSDVWSVHQLYHHATPKAVQFAEALTSTHWELPRPSVLQRTGRLRPDRMAWVIETGHGIEGHCLVEHRSDGVVVRMMMTPECHASAVPFAASAAREAGVGPSTRVRLLVPAYDSELVRPLEEAGFTVAAERIALVRHTTVHAVVRVRPALLPVEVGERVPSGIPTYLRAVRESRARYSRRRGRVRIERTSN